MLCSSATLRAGPDWLYRSSGESAPSAGSSGRRARCSQVFSIEGRGGDLFAAVERLDLEGIVANRQADPYGPETVWYKIKNPAYTQAEGRWELFRRRRG